MAIADWNRYIAALRSACREQGATFPPARNGGEREPSFDVAPPASPSDIAAVESTLGMALPASLRKVFTEYSGAVDIAWQLPEGVEPPEPFAGIFGGQLDFNLQRLYELQQLYIGMAEDSFTDSESEYDRVWQGKFAFLDVPNGDMIAIDIADEETQPVVYLSHDDGEGHGYRLGDSAEDFIDRFLQIGCPGPEDWQWLPFVSGPDSGILPTGPDAGPWRQWFKLRI